MSKMMKSYVETRQKGAENAFRRSSNKQQRSEERDATKGNLFSKRGSINRPVEQSRNSNEENNGNLTETPYRWFYERKEDRVGPEGSQCRVLSEDGGRLWGRRVHRQKASLITTTGTKEHSLVVRRKGKTQYRPRWTKRVPAPQINAAGSTKKGGAENSFFLGLRSEMQGQNLGRENLVVRCLLRS